MGPMICSLPPVSPDRSRSWSRTRSSRGRFRDVTGPELRSLQKVGGRRSKNYSPNFSVNTNRVTGIRLVTTFPLISGLFRTNTTIKLMSVLSDPDPFGGSNSPRKEEEYPRPKYLGLSLRRPALPGTVGDSYRPAPCPGPRSDDPELKVDPV